MSKNRLKLDLGRLRAQAKQQLKQLRRSAALGGVPTAEALEIALRLSRLRSFSGKSPAELLQQTDQFRLKHLLALLAEENGYPSWAEVVRSSSLKRERPSLMDQSDSMYEPGMSGLMNRWFANYDEALESLREHGGYLLPYRNQFYITERAGIEVLGLDPEDPDWKSIGDNWVNPADQDAWDRLVAKREASRARKESGQVT